METIIAPTDFSPASSNAIEYAVELAKYFTAKIILVNAYPLPPISYETPFWVEADSTMNAAVMEKLLALKKEIQEKHGALDIECIADIGSPFDVIDAVASVSKADLIVMGIVGEAGGLKEHIIGSTAITVARRQEVPTFIIPEGVKYHRIHKISFACDLKKTEETDLIYVAKFFSKVFEAELEMINVESPEEGVTTEKAATYLFVENKLENVKHETYHISGEKVPFELEEYFKAYPTDVILLSPKKHNLFYYLFNQSITHNLAFHTKMPILAIH